MAMRQRDRYERVVVQIHFEVADEIAGAFKR